MTFNEFAKKHIWDGAVTLLLVLTSCAVLTYYLWPKNSTGDVYASVYVSAKKTDLVAGKSTIDLTTVTEGKTYTIQGKQEGKAGEVTISVEPGKIAIVSSGCKNQFCVRSGYISEPGQSLICAPNEILITLDGSTGEVYI